MDGEHRECPIVPDQAIRLNYGTEEEYLLVAPSHDVIVMFPDPKYNHLRYWSPEERRIKAIWLNDEMLADLNDAGIPVVIRNSISECEYSAYKEYLAHIALESVEVDYVEIPDEYDRVMPQYIEEDSSFEAEILDATKNLDAELRYFLSE